MHDQCSQMIKNAELPKGLTQDRLSTVMTHHLYGINHWRHLEQYKSIPRGNKYPKSSFLISCVQYAFPQSSVGETGRVGAPSRREIGHGTLAERALERILPAVQDFPYTVRVETTITESNGSSRFGLGYFYIGRFYALYVWQ